jgi:hypothetical protein
MLVGCLPAFFFCFYHIAELLEKERKPLWRFQGSFGVHHWVDWRRDEEC